jgi:hypothetical protein
LHGNGLIGASPVTSTGAFLPDFSNFRGTYTRNSASLLARVTVPGNASAYTYEPDSMVIDGGFRKYSKMLVQKTNTTNTLFLSTLFPYTLVSPLVLPASQGGASTSARITADNYHDLVFCSHGGVLVNISADSSGMNKAIKGNGKINFLSEDSNGHFASAFLQYGDSIIGGTQPIIKTLKKMDIAWMKIDSVLYGGFTSDFGTVKFYSERALQILDGPVSSISYDSLHHLSEAVFSGKGNFILGPEDLTWIWTGSASEDWHNEANWQMADHPSIRGIPVATNNVIIPSGTMQMPVVSSDNPAICHDLTISPDATLTVDSMKFLIVTGTLTLEGN